VIHGVLAEINDEIFALFVANGERVAVGANAARGVANRIVSTPPSKKSGSVKFTQWRLPHQFQQASGLSRAPELSHCSLH
jgi:hypothetical protein